jgi:hypothetical protein
LQRLWQANYSPAAQMTGVLLLAALPFAFVLFLLIALEYLRAPRKCCSRGRLDAHPDASGRGSFSEERLGTGVVRRKICRWAHREASHPF